MFRKLFELWHREGLLQQALNDAQKMLDNASILFKKSVAPLFFDEPVNAQEIYDMDRELNRYEVEIRRKVMEHLSIFPKQDTTAALVLTTITVDIERIGDYSKNFLELWEIYGSSFSKAAVFERLKKIYNNILDMFQLTMDAMSNADAEQARKAMELHIVNSKDCEEIIAALIRNPGKTENLAPNQEVLAALTSRYLKRVSAHLKNVASSVVNPFDRIGFKPPDAEDF
ncbi:hypothetical protein J7M00_02175 [bacterium]|nr:hypothetical protein [bacterium]RKZ25118.1 MAG: hypothetical protein DRQ26_06440 [bacterium]